MITIRGSTEECLAHYLQQLPSSITRNGITARKPIVRYCRCTPKTIHKWSTGTVPVGMMLVRVRYFLAALGYEVEDLMDLSDEIRNFGKLIADGRLDEMTLRARLNYRDDHAILSMLHGSRKPTPDRLEIIKQIVGQQVIPPSFTPKSDATTVVSPSTNSATDRQKVIQALAVLLKGALPLAQLLEHVPYTAADRDYLHSLLTGNEVFHLIFSLKRLSSETAHDHIPPRPRAR